MKQNTLIIIFLLLLSCTPSRKDIIDKAVNVPLDAYPTGKFVIELSKKNYIPSQEEKEFIKEFKLRIKPINKLKLDHHIYFIDHKGKKVALAETIWGYVDSGPITIFDDSYTLRKENSKFIFKIIKHTE